jgi:PEGA domain
LIATTAVTSASLALLAVWLLGPAPPEAERSVPVLVLQPAPARQPPPAVQPAPARQPAAAIAAQQGARVAASIRTPAPSTRVAAAPPARKAALSSVQPAKVATRREVAGRPQGAGAASGLVVVTEPTGARVTINGVGWGSTPLTIPYLPPGAKRIRVTLPGFESAERVVTVDTGSPSQKVHITLREEAETRDPS